MKRWSIVASAALVIGCAGDVPLASDNDDNDVGSAEAPLLGTARVPTDVLRALARHDDLTEAELDEVHVLEHYLRIGRGRQVHVTERFTLRSWLRWPHRAALLLPGTLSNASFYNLDVDGYRFQDTLAREGFFAFSVDYEGVGSSTYPADGYDVDHEYLVEEQRRVLTILRLLRLVPEVDIIGESNGGAIAAELCARHGARSCVLASMLYVDGTDFFNAVFLDPGFVFFLSNQPDGYIDATPALYFNITASMSPEVGAATLASQPGLYAAGPLIAPVDGLPWFDATRARVPALIIQGTMDNIATQEDADLLAAAYGSHPTGGGHATVFRIEGAGHIPRVEPAPNNQAWTDAVLQFLAE